MDSNPSIRATSPSTMPLRMAASVLLPMTAAGARSSTMGSLAVPRVSAWAPMPMPGAIMPPTKVPSASTTSKFVVVPRSTTTTGAP